MFMDRVEVALVWTSGIRRRDDIVTSYPNYVPQSELSGGQQKWVTHFVCRTLHFSWAHKER